MAVGLVKPTQGGFYYGGRPVGAHSRREIAYMSTEPYFYPWMTARDVGNYYADFFEDFARDRYGELLERMELAFDMKTKVLSSGMMAKLKIAATLARRAKVYLLDEPLNGIDLLAREQIAACIQEAATRETAIVLSSHLVDELERLADVAVFMKNGRLVETCSVEELRMLRNKTMTDQYREIYGHGGGETYGKADQV